MLIIPGGRAFSDFIQSKLLTKLQADVPVVTAVHARYQHFADVEQELDTSQTELLESLLSYGEQQDTATPSGELFLKGSTAIDGFDGRSKLSPSGLFSSGLTTKT